MERIEIATSEDWGVNERKRGKLKKSDHQLRGGTGTNIKPTKNYVRSVATKPESCNNGDKSKRESEGVDRAER